MSTDTRHQIEVALRDFAASDLRAASIGLLNTLGYQSDKTLDIGGSPEAFLSQFDNNPDRAFHKDKAFFNDWKEIHLLFQLTDQELSGQNNLFKDNDVTQGLMSSYLFFALRLKEVSYTRGKLAQITRQLNRLFPMPVMVMFEYSGKLSIAVINRRRSKRDADKDVLGKVTFIHDINLRSPHRGHLDILRSLSLSILAGKTGIHSFDDLHTAWEEIFNVELLNKNFYRKLSNWYFWAMSHVHFPFDDVEADKSNLFRSEEKIREHDAKNLIRLLTRLLFVWFIKEKGLIPEPLFDQDKLAHMLLNDFEPDSSDTRFYKAILQNLFFATLNQTCGERKFRNPGRQHRNITTLMRYEKFFKDPNTFLEMLESAVPFMNGGLFECLDKPHPTKKGPQGGDVILHEDGFSDHKDNTLKVPDFLFFGKERVVDLSDVYGDKKRKREKVSGIINILNHYKFTIVENTPIEQEIALDPELLGKVFENLLASYNPETKTTARKQTGSFYTPRTIVDYMVDESLKAYLNKALCEACPEVTKEDAKEGLDILFSYTEKEHAFSNTEKYALIVAIDNCKILDPACGSGAFPMGILHKLEFILGKLDKNNKLWRDRQISKVNDTIAVAERIDDSVIREKTIKELEAQKKDIEEAFANNDLSYGRKLYLIENCIYGVDIQPIATQVSKLRFFISLIVEQSADVEKDNFGIRPLPNLETKFTTADTLIHITKKDDQLELGETATVKALEKELKQIRHNIFSAKTPKTKRKYRLRDKELREEIAAELEALGWSSNIARQLSQWDPYDQNASSPFFDAEWMYGITDGFDVVIGNPPYVQIQKFPKAQKEKWLAQKYQTYSATADIYCLFYERGSQLLKPGGHLCYITSNNWMRANYGSKLRKFLTKDMDPIAVLDFGMGLNFNAAAALTNILLLAKHKNTHKVLCCYASDSQCAMAEPASYFYENAVFMPELDESSWVVVSPERYRIKKEVEAQGLPLEKWNLNINYGIKTGLNDAFYLTQAQRDELIAKEPQAKDILVPLLRGRFVERYKTNWDRTWMIATLPSLGLDIEKYPLLKQHLQNYLPKLKQTGESFINAEGKKEKTRKKTQNKWFETQDAIAYYAEFSKPKIIYPNMTKYLPFYYDNTDQFFCNQKCFIITSDRESLPYLIAILNSSLFCCCFRDNFPNLGADRRELSKVFFNKVPIKKPSDSEAVLFEKMVAMVQLAKVENLDVPAAFIEEVIDACVMELYFPEEAAAKNLRFIEPVSALLEPMESVSKESIEAFFSVANDSKHAIRNQLIRLTVDSPDLFAIIKREGTV